MTKNHLLQLWSLKVQGQRVGMAESQGGLCSPLLSSVWPKVLEGARNPSAASSVRTLSPL